MEVLRNISSLHLWLRYVHALMDHSAMLPSASSSDNSGDPFADPVLPSQAYQPEPEQSAPSGVSHVPTSFRAPSGSESAPQIRGREISNNQHPSNIPPRSQTVTDAILPVRPVSAASHDAVHGATPNDTIGADGLQSTNSSLALSQLVTRRQAGEPVDCSPDIIKKGKRKIYTMKWIFIITLLALK